MASWQGAYRGLLPDSLLDNLSAARREVFWEKELVENQHNVLVFIQAGRVVGFTNFGPSRDEGADQAKTGEIFAIYFTPETWGSGCGTELAEAALAALGSVQDRLRECCRGWRWVKPAGIHLTLKFLGEADEAADLAGRPRWRDACAGGRPASLTLG